MLESSFGIDVVNSEIFLRFLAVIKIRVRRGCQCGILMTFSVRHIVVLFRYRAVRRCNQSCASKMVRNEVSCLVSAACLIRSASRCCDTFQCNIGITAIIFERTYVIISHARRIDCLDFSSVGEICVGCFHGRSLLDYCRQVKKNIFQMQIK